MLTSSFAGGEGGVGCVSSVPNAHQWALLLTIACAGAGEREGWAVVREPETEDHVGSRWVQTPFAQSGTIQVCHQWKGKLQPSDCVCVSQKSLGSCPPCGRHWARPTATTPSRHQPAGVTTMLHTCISSTRPTRTLSSAPRSTVSSSKRTWAGTFLSLGARLAPRMRRCQGTSG